MDKRNFKKNNVYLGYIFKLPKIILLINNWPAYFSVWLGLNGDRGRVYRFRNNWKIKIGEPVAIPNIDNVVIGNNVEIGALNTIARGTLKNTTIGNFVKTDDHVHIAHNVDIGERTIITACAEVSGGVRIGSDTRLGPNCSIMNNITVGNKVLIGLGAAVTKSVSDNVVAGNPANILRKNG